MLQHPVFHRRSEKGQSFVELGLSLVFLLILLAAVVDLGWAFFTVISLRDAAQEAATVGSICPNEIATIRSRLKASATTPIDFSKFSDSQIEVCIYNPTTKDCNTNLVANTALGRSVQVSITYNHKIVTPMVGSFIGAQEYPIKVTSSATILRLDCKAFH